MTASHYLATFLDAFSAQTLLPLCRKLSFLLEDHPLTPTILLKLLSCLEGESRSKWEIETSETRKNRQMSLKVAQN